ncbi:SUF system Fe-S cluster assembly regulator [Alcaligenes endophyticus]|uniref:SUF system Fe-S cluster assembly regulator n=1 Tax=Alcaligenes endophyticus TaxID=1929088 RepID=A0ABT8EIS6_9BURK|nr:SUF system Fe-S cluster assembly regulator [Alcaligenes endophyticus]MCX5592471.1 SUF system Fe-S cluster assembly regulator [Alcaligenes endophyticus]MDN4121196.1 SUF system Fe-S cluster assembly regulator [Alcaligenes endophyticus]
MLRISKIIDYGTLVLTHMAGEPERVFSASDLANILGLGQPTVSKVLKMLGQHKLVISSRGARGGYVLGRPAKQISVAQIIDALEEQPFGLTECVATPGACSVEPDCHIRSNWQRINDIVRRTLEEVSVADMVKPTMSEHPLTHQPGTVLKNMNKARTSNMEIS